MTNEELLHSIGGELTTITVLLRAMIETHPNPALLKSLFEEKFQAALASTTPTGVKDAYIQGMHEKHSDLWA